MEVGKLLELIRGQHICQEAEYLHVSELDVILTFLQVCVVQIHDALGDAKVAHLLRLVLEFDHVDRNLVLDVHVSSL